jgi:hypothetical protein
LRDRADKRKSADRYGVSLVLTRTLRFDGRGVRSMAVVASVAVVALALLTSSASAKESRVVESSFGVGELSLATNSGVAVNDVTHDVYVADTGDGDIAEYESDGTAIGTFGSLGTPTFIAVDNSGTASQGSVYVVDAGDNSVSKFAATGTPDATWGTAGTLGGFGGIAGIAVDNTGGLYLLEENSRVRLYSSAGVEGGSFEAPRGTSVAGLAVDSAGDLYKVDATQEVTKFDTAGSTLAVNLTGRSNALGLGIDPANDDLYVLNGNLGSPSVSVFPVGCGNECAAKETFGEAELDGASGTAIDPGLGSIYVVDPTAGRIDTFGSKVTVPDVTAEAVAGVAARGATFHGIVNPVGLPVTECKFEYFTEGGTKSSVPCIGTIPADENNHAVEATVSGLEPTTRYTVRLVVRGPHGPSISAVSFATKPILDVEPATEVTASHATLHGAIYSEGSPIEGCAFEYADFATIEEKGFASAERVNCEVGAGNPAVPVEAELMGLAYGTGYEYRISATIGGVQQFSSSEILQTRGPVLESVAPLEVTQTGADAYGRFNPHGEADSYLFEYVTEAQFLEDEWAQATQLPAGGESAPESEGSVAVRQPIIGLTPMTTYHLRLVVTAMIGGLAESFPSAERLFTTVGESGASGLPDGRAYEQASPVDKNGASIEGSLNHVAASSNGNRVIFYANAGLPGGTGAQDSASFVATRGSSGWTTEGILPPASSGPVARVEGWSESLDSTFGIALPEEEQAATNASLLQRESGQGRVNVITPSARWGTTEGDSTSTAIAATTADDSIVAFESKAALAEGAEAEQSNVFVWDRATGQVSLAGRANEPAPLEGGTVAGPFNYLEQANEELNPGPGGARSHYYTQELNTLSKTGNRLFFTRLDGNQLFVRLNPTAAQSSLEGGRCTEAAKACTVEVSRSQASGPDPNGPKPAVFVDATPSGGNVFFISRGALTDDATTGDEDEGSDLYRYNVASEKLDDLVPDAEPGDPAGAEVVGMVGASEDGSRLYFVANSVLASGATKGDCRVSREFRPGGEHHCNLYEWDNGRVTFVAKMEVGIPTDEIIERGLDRRNWEPASNYDSFAKLEQDNTTTPLVEPGLTTGSQATGRVSANGEDLMFVSVASPTSYDSHGVEEIYRFDASTQTVSCISCNPSGAAPRGPATLSDVQPTYLPANKGAVSKVRNLSLDGKRIVFETYDSLVAADTNGVEDVYEWEESTGGACTGVGQQEADGCLYLISTGTSPVPSHLLGASATGDDIFFFTAQPLVAQDQDELTDVYDARVNGGIAAQNQIPPIPCGSEAACQAPPAGAASTNTPGSSLFTGPGNPKVKSCKKGFVHKTGRCVKKKQKKHGRKKKTKRGGRRSVHHQKANDRNGGAR